MMLGCPELEDELEDELELPGSGSPGHPPMEVVPRLHPGFEEEMLQGTVNWTVVVSSSIPVPKDSSMTMLICLLGVCIEGRETVVQAVQPPVGLNRLPNVPRYSPFSYTLTIGIVLVEPFA
jgi:hypothetical protein